MDALATEVMDKYESRTRERRLTLPSSGPNRRTKHFYKRLFDDEGAYQLEFVSWAGEVLAQWIESHYSETIHVQGGRPHNNEPAYDSVSVILDEHNNIAIRVVQAKSTGEYVASRCSEAARNFGKLEKGEYDAQFASFLALMEENIGPIPGVNFMDFLHVGTDSRRRYRITAVYGKEPSGQLLTSYDTHVVGPDSRRSLCLMTVEEWATFWSELGRYVYERLS